MTKTDTRELILGILLEIDGQKGFSHVVIRNVLDKYQYLEKQERAFLSRVAQGTLERRLELDYILNQFSKVSVNKMKPVIRNLLRMSVYQLKYMDRVPDAAVCNEAVRLARKKGFASLTGFVNGVLRSIARGIGEISYPPDPRIISLEQKERKSQNDLEKLKEQTAEYLSVRYSMPAWIVKEWLGEYGRDVTEGMLAAFLLEAVTTIRVNTGQITPKELQSRLEAEGIEVETIPEIPYALRIRGYDSLRRIPAFQEGLFFIQDISSMLAVEAAEVKKGSCCLDVCAAPGGKAMQLSQLLEGTGLVEARDLTEDKVRLIKENVERLKASQIRVRAFDARVLDKEMIEEADVVLADLPCSGLGVLGKKPDIKYRITPQSMEELAGLQREILETAWRYVKPGGTLIYSTCTINAQENQENVRWLLEHAPLVLEPLPRTVTDFAGKTLGTQETGMCQLLPGEYGNDGFFIARFRRRAKEEEAAQARANTCQTEEKRAANRG
ncbi:MAG: 16S rRNA (cytosine(967)-C(5))-methyltransferase RsmB [Lachnospiraceae bacterium]|nr:16S rRNA (cytosine(967)-C(5))-methyltransferase RsmB [Lachnospiraceae bacterium]